MASEDVPRRYKIYVAAAMRPGSPTNYINFDLATAVRLRDSLDECIEFAQRRSGAAKPYVGLDR